MKKTFGKRDLFWGYAGYLSEIAVYALLTPVLAIFLDSFELGLWYTFMSIYSFLTLFDGAFSPIMTRNASYCMSGASQLVADGLPPISECRQPNYGLLSALYTSNRRLMRIIAGGAYIILLAMGLPYVYYITRTAFDIRFMFAWVIFVTGISLNLYFLAVPSLMKGFGHIASAQKYIVSGRSIQLVICIGSVFLGSGIMGLSFGILAGALIIGVLSNRFMRYNLLPLFPPKAVYATSEIIRTIWYNSKKLLIAAIGSYGISQMNTLLCSTFIALEATASYGLTNQAFQAVNIVAFVWMQTATPAISVAKAQKDLKKQRSLFSVACVVQYSVSVLGSVAVILLANPLLGFLGAKTLLLGIPLIFFSALNAFIEKHISLYSNYIMCGNRVPYVKASLLSGAAVCCLSGLSILLTDWGILGLLLSQTLVQLSYNTWKWCTVACHELELSWPTLLRTGVINSIVALKKLLFPKRGVDDNV